MASSIRFQLKVAQERFAWFYRGVEQAVAGLRKTGQDIPLGIHSQEARRDVRQDSIDLVRPLRDFVLQ